MARKPSPIDGVIADIAAVESHPSGWRIRFRLNGSWTERYRSTKEDAESLQSDLEQRARAAKAGLVVAPTNLPAHRLRIAETAFRLLDGAELTNVASESTDQRLILAVQRFIADTENAATPVKIEDAYALFVARLKASNTAKKTVKDYDRFILRRFMVGRKGQTVGDIETSDYYTFIHGQSSDAAKFKSYTVLYSFLNFCTGKNNPHIDPNKDQPWLKRNPINFPKPEFKPSRVESYTLDEIKTLLKSAKDNGSLGYFIFRFFGLIRYDEFLRFQKHGKDWDTHSDIDLTNNRIHITAEVSKLRVPRDIPIGETFRKWIDYLIKKENGFGYDRTKEEAARKAIPHKYGVEATANLPRHTALTMHTLCFNKPSVTVAVAGTSLAELQKKYTNVKIDPKDADGFYKLTPQKMGFK